MLISFRGSIRWIKKWYNVDAETEDSESDLSNQNIEEVDEEVGEEDEEEEEDEIEQTDDDISEEAEIENKNDLSEQSDDEHKQLENRPNETGNRGKQIYFKFYICQI